MNFPARAPGSATRVLLIEDHSLLSDGIKQLIASQLDYEVVGVVDDGLEAYASCQRLSPDLVILDLGLPGMDGNDVIYQLKQRWPELIIIVLTADSNEHRARSALEAGALSYVLKKSSQQTLLAALQMAKVGRAFIDPLLDQQQITETKTLEGQVRLTLRERQILKLIAEGNRNRDIAESLKITIKTVETHRLNLMRKLDAHSAVELTNWAVRLGIHHF
ncbi:two component system response regulator [Rahnella sp. SAP-1]|jgi:two-component system secretion response regulator SsrB|uniref:Two component system response regulator n=1 Tax=Rouxiella aceris TaxID=2703884 RepID=A0A848MH34_9GAMM|nr:two component system response regulator [Rouxiella aceris]NMP26461.1 two component system response regulator [Rouxiella aceris]